MLFLYSAMQTLELMQINTSRLDKNVKKKLTNEYWHLLKIL